MHSRARHVTGVLAGVIAAPVLGFLILKAAADLDQILRAFAWARMDEVFADLLPPAKASLTTAINSRKPIYSRMNSPTAGTASTAARSISTKPTLPLCRRARCSGFTRA